MTKIDQRIALAEARGWTKVELYEDNAGPPIWHGNPPADFIGRNKYDTTLTQITLDEMFIVEKELLAQSIYTYRAYVSILYQVMSKERDDASLLVHATAWQKCEAVLRLLGDWKE